MKKRYPTLILGDHHCPTGHLTRSGVMLACLWCPKVSQQWGSREWWAAQYYICIFRMSYFKTVYFSFWSCVLGKTLLWQILVISPVFPMFFCKFKVQTVGLLCHRCCLWSFAVRVNVQCPAGFICTPAANFQFVFWVNLLNMRTEKLKTFPSL